MNPDNTTGNVVSGGVTNNPAVKRENLVQYSDHPTFNFGLALAWLVALFSILATVYFWWLNKNIEDVIVEKQSKKDAIEQQIQSPSMVKVQKDATDFKASVNILSNANKDRFSMAQFLPELYKKITTDTQITSLTISSDGSLSLAGKTKKYRTIADLTMALRSWSMLKDVDILSASMSEDDTKLPAVFSITGKIVKNANTNAAPGSAVNSNTNSAGGL